VRRRWNGSKGAPGYDAENATLQVRPHSSTITPPASTLVSQNDRRDSGGSLKRTITAAAGQSTVIPTPATKSPASRSLPASAAVSTSSTSAKAQKIIHAA